MRDKERKDKGKTGDIRKIPWNKKT